MPRHGAPGPRAGAFVGRVDGRRGCAFSSFPLIAALLGLLLVAQVQYGLAIAGGIWQVILSWDNPATHAFEDSASLTAPSTDPTRQAAEHTLAATRLLGHLPLSEEQGPAQGPGFSGRLTRSPPTA